MSNFKFSSKTVQLYPVFSGQVFYAVYKDVDFLRERENIDAVLVKGFELRASLKNIVAGEFLKINGMNLDETKPLLIKKTGPKVIIKNYEFTMNRLSGLVAAYAFDNRSKFRTLASSEAIALGLTWNNKNKLQCCLFLSSVSGSEHFYEQFGCLPLLCALRKLQLKKITIEPVIKMAKIKNPQGVQMVKEFMDNLGKVQKLWLYFPGATVEDLNQLLQSAPPTLKQIMTMH
ncbi:uncharacterized protein LOC124534740 [Vanessa cardui]|uniref:uncharacterized protein LOC124534740 n=1 Tax=Vanessa cardui TaxID=171605 RepID=UPI001F129195|nr:uncharacterized protein LOC124534740 [Vanessa cardui]XP_046966695.1 uncharacterized protein LOC124534740 [Vanessa cardui]XP_046966696.1 uncharacterized protein LOC124534740 [Vanessa cardui]